MVREKPYAFLNSLLQYRVRNKIPKAFAFKLQIINGPATTSALSSSPSRNAGKSPGCNASQHHCLASESSARCDCILPSSPHRRGHVLGGYGIATFCRRRSSEPLRGAQITLSSFDILCICKLTCGFCSPMQCPALGLNVCGFSHVSLIHPCRTNTKLTSITLRQQSP